MDDWQTILIGLKPYADFFSIIGAAIVFFSWVISSTLQQRYQAAKSSVESAKSERRLYGEFADVKLSVDSLTRFRVFLYHGRHPPVWIEVLVWRGRLCSRSS
jgi:hypothetical protein